MRKVYAATKKQIRRWLGARLPYSAARTKKWHVKRRMGKNIIQGTAIGFSYTPNDRALVLGLLKNLDFVEYVVSYYDNNKHSNFKYNEAERHMAIIRKARRSGAKYFWGVSPKKRVSDEAIQIIKDNMHIVEQGNVMMTNSRFFWGKDLRNVRTDGLWGKRRASVFFPILPTNRYRKKPLHHRWRPRNLPRVYLDINQYYIGRHTEEILKKKFNFYKSRKYQTDFWKNAAFESFISDDLDFKPITEHIRGVGWREKHFKG